MSFALRMDLSQLGVVAHSMAQLSALDKPALLDDIGFLVENQTKTRIRDEKRAPDGSPWAPLSEDYAARKREKKGDVGLLEFDGKLFRSIQYFVEGDAVYVGSNLVQAAHLQFGGEEFDSGMPAREYLGFSTENVEDINDLVTNFLRRHVEQLT